MATIKLLDKITIDKIAAGEVIERPSSVVKELVENSIDSGATAIAAEIRDGGISLIRVTDNGSGFKPDSVEIAFKRHSTSKITDASDLMNISSLGFRGEALSSIGAVSQVTLLSKTEDELEGIRFCFRGGEMVSLEKAGVPKGTTMLVENLFYNTPARKKFLKKDRTEAGYVETLIRRLALSHPSIAFDFISNGKTVISTPGTGSLKDAIFCLYGRDFTGNLVEIDAELDDMKLHGFIGTPMSARGNRAFENFFVNGRFVEDAVLAKATEEAYKNYLMLHQFPSVVLFFELPPSKVDVNVHPAKAHVRFDEEEKVYAFVRDAVADTLAHREFIPEIEEGGSSFVVSGSTAALKNEVKRAPAPKPNPQPFEKALEPERPVVEEAEKPKPATPFIYSRPEETTCEEKPAPAPKEPQREVYTQISIPLPENNKPTFRLIGKYRDTYWLIEYEQKLYMIDQHAAHEKVNYEKFYKQFRENTFSSQRVYPPHIVSLTPEEKELVEEIGEVLNRYGFEVEPFGGNEYAVYSVPTDLYGMKEEEFFRLLVDEFSLKTDKEEDFDPILRRLATAACKASVKGGDDISREEALVLLNDLFALENPYNCPHGRPTMISFTEAEIEKMFKRIVT
ncbi:MAG: DNA mismatch repair endonuclease MutL [Eubacterium sp.]|nr:DNA mismatch repair endonuclease MutL [Eubacterium sp.]